MKTKIEATIPTTQYGNLRPTFELEDEGDTELALSELAKMWQRFGESPLKDKHGGGVKITTFTGEDILWNEDAHVYTDMAGKVLLSGSKYADMHSPKFDMEMILPKTAKAWDVPAEVLKEIWKMNGDMANFWGSAIHKSLEILHKHGKTGEHIQGVKSLEDNYVMPKNSYLSRVVKEFIEKFGVNGEPEIVVSDVANGRAGTIDRLEVLDWDKKICRVGDYKTNTEMDSKKRLKYQKQLSYYAHILVAHGWTVTGLDLFHLDHNDGWVKEEMEVLGLE